MNLKLFLEINGLANRWPLLDAVMIFCAHYLIYIMILAVLTHVLFGYKRWRDMILVAIGSAFIARFIIASGIRLFYKHARPDPETLLELQLLLIRETQPSFPSGHTIFVFALATAVFLYNKKVGLWFYGAALLIGFSRIFVGVHWPLDILGGIVLGVPTTLLCDKLYRKYKHLLGIK